MRTFKGSHSFKYDWNIGYWNIQITRVFKGWFPIRSCRIYKLGIKTLISIAFGRYVLWIRRSCYPVCIVKGRKNTWI